MYEYCLWCISAVSVSHCRRALKEPEELGRGGGVVGWGVGGWEGGRWGGGGKEGLVWVCIYIFKVQVDGAKQLRLPGKERVGRGFQIHDHLPEIISY